MQKTLLQIVQALTAEISENKPSEVITSTDNSVLQYLAFIRAVCDDLIREHDWNFLQQRYTFDTVVGQDAYAWPSDYARGINGTFFDTSNRWPIIPTTPTQWEILKMLNISPGPFEWLRVFNGKMNFYPVPASVYTFVFDYISINHVVDGNTGDTKSDFTQDSDICMFDYRLVLYGAKYKLFAQKGLDTSEVFAAYNRTLNQLKGQDTFAPRLSFLMQNDPRLASNANYSPMSWVTS